MSRILIVDDEKSIRSSIDLILRRAGHDVECVASVEEADATLRSESFDLVLSDVRLRGASGMELLKRIQKDHARVGVVMMSGFATVEQAVRAIRLGASDYLAKPFETDELLDAVDAALNSEAKARPELVASPTPGRTSDEVVGRSKAILDLLDLVRRTATTDSTVLITGETGTGKELIGRAIHRGSGRRSRVFSAVNSAAFPETLLESELFGHRKGAFTGASANKKGLFESADGGTFFLDEVAEMPLSMQAKLLRFLQTGEIRPVGAEETRCVDVRLVAATNKDLEREVEAGRFREDLYYRLAVIPVHVPPLRERGSDIPLLAVHFLRGFAKKLAKDVTSIDPECMDLLCSYAWPGNVRELENCIERCVALSTDTKIAPLDLPLRVRDRSGPADPSGVASLQGMERTHILNTLDKVNWNRRRAAELLEISTTTLWRRLKEFGIEPGARPRQTPDGSMVTR